MKFVLTCLFLKTVIAGTGLNYPAWNNYKKLLDDYMIRQAQPMSVGGHL
jgi:hypothetical protein